MHFIDTHSHLYDEAFDGDRDAAAGRAFDSGVTKLVLPAIDISSFERQSSFAQQYPDNTFMAMGLHPTSVGEDYKRELDFVEAELRKSFADSGEPKRYCAVGEIGLDAYWSRDFMREQIDVLSAQIDMAEEYNLPIIIHLRNATDEMFDLLESKPHTLKGVFHAFGGSYETYCRIKKYGDFRIGVGGVVTFKNASLAQTVAKVPLQDILLETDSPWLTPSPHRGERNESSYIPFIAAKIAQIKEIDIEEVAEQTTLNAEQLFRI